jgi:predicted ArsR family transcriptional regulator
VLALLKKHGPIGDKELAEKLGLSIRGATFLMSKLEKSKKAQ